MHKAIIMKKIISICFLVFFAVTGNAQKHNKTNLNDLNQDQLNLALTKSLKTIKTGKILTGVGAGLGFTGGILLLDDMNKRNNNTGVLGGLPTGETAAGLLMVIGGIITEVIGIPTWIKGSKRKKDIEIELIKFNPKGSASINGIGLKIRF
jgi:hypothetical protein